MVADISQSDASKVCCLSLLVMVSPQSFSCTINRQTALQHYGVNRRVFPRWAESRRQPGHQREAGDSADIVMGKAAQVEMVRMRATTSEPMPFEVVIFSTATRRFSIGGKEAPSRGSGVRSYHYL